MRNTTKRLNKNFESKSFYLKKSQLLKNRIWMNSGLLWVIMMLKDIIRMPLKF